MERTLTKYKAEEGRVFAYFSDGTREERTTALTTSGRDLERFDGALQAARIQKRVNKSRWVI